MHPFFKNILEFLYTQCINFIVFLNKLIESAPIFQYLIFPLLVTVIGGILVSKFNKDNLRKLCIFIGCFGLIVIFIIITFYLLSFIIFLISKIKKYGKILISYIGNLLRNSDYKINWSNKTVWIVFAVIVCFIIMIKHRRNQRKRIQSKKNKDDSMKTLDYKMNTDTKKHFTFDDTSEIKDFYFGDKK